MKNIFGENKKLFAILFAIEIFFLVIGIMGLFGKNRVYRFDADDMTAKMGGYSSETDEYYVDSSLGWAGTAVELTGIALPKGVYTISLRYETDTFVKNLCNMIYSHH